MPRSFMALLLPMWVLGKRLFLVKRGLNAMASMAMSSMMVVTASVANVLSVIYGFVCLSGKGTTFMRYSGIVWH